MVYFSISGQCPKTVGDLSLSSAKQSSPSDAKIDNVFIIKQPSECRKLFGINLIADGNGTIKVAHLDNKGSVKNAESKDVTTGLNIIEFDKQQGDTVAIKASNAVIIPGNGNSETLLYPNSNVLIGSPNYFEKKASQSVNTTFNVIGIFQGMHL